MAVTAGKLWGATNKVELQRWNSMDRVLETLWQYYLVRRSNKKARRVRLDIYYWEVLSYVWRVRKCRIRERGGGSDAGVGQGLQVDIWRAVA